METILREHSHARCPSDQATVPIASRSSAASPGLVPWHAPGRDGQAWSPTARTAAAIITSAGLAVLAAGCGGSPSSHVAQPGTTATRSSSSSPGPASVQVNGALAFSRCMRSNGIPNFPDPNPSGVLPKSQLEQIAASNPGTLRPRRHAESCSRTVPSLAETSPPRPS